jgi:ferrochelatase
VIAGAETRVAVVLFNLGGPDGPAAVKPFLFNLFSDPAIIGLPNPLRWVVAKLISSRRAAVAREIYAKIGGGSPILQQTREQATALQAALTQGASEREQFRVFVAMRYWNPLAGEVAREVKAWQPDHVVLLPLYPQYSTTTSGSSLAQWRRVATAAGLLAPASAVCCYPDDAGWVAAQTRLIETSIDKSLAATRTSPRILFSAHGLPKKVVERGDPYQWQVERTVAAMVARLQGRQRDHAICYQSRVGPLEWIGPSTEAEIARAAKDRVPLVVVPVAFVSEHSETLVELDIEYREKAHALGVPAYERTPTVRTEPEFIGGLAALTRGAMTQGGLTNSAGARICPATCGRCAMAGA